MNIQLSVRPVLSTLMLLTGLAAQVANAEVNPLRLGTAHEALFGIDASEERIAAVGAWGAWLNSHDGGESWVTQDTGTQLALLDVALGRQQDVAVGQMGTVVVCVKGQCSLADSGSQERLMAVVQGEDMLVTVGGFGTVLLSDDGGNSWQPINPDWSSFTEQGLQPHLYDVKVLPGGEIVIAGEFGLILQSADQGGSWQTLHSGDESIFSVNVVNDGLLYAAGQGNTILRSTDAGETWTRLTPAGASNWLSVRGTADGMIYVAGMREMMRSSDGGDHWEAVTGETVGMLWFAGLQVAPATGHVLGVGQAGTVIQMRRE